MATTMGYSENLKVALQSVKSNKLRTFLTAIIIAIGLTALVGILTSIDAIEGSLNNTFSSMGANSFTIRNRGIGIRIGGGGERPKRFTPITYEEALNFKSSFNFPAMVSVNTFASFAATAKVGNQKTNPNISVLGADENYLLTGGYKLALGRNFSQAELEFGSGVVIIGNEVKTRLFKDSDPINKIITVGNNKFKVIGVFAEKGSSMGFGGDKVCVVPLLKAKQIMTIPNPSYTISVIAEDPLHMESAIGESTGLFRNIRRLSAAQENNFEISKSDAIAQTLVDNLKFVRIGGITIGAITLIGAAIALMNIMIVSVTERTREIGIRKAIGATPVIIRRQFLIEATVICLMGGVTGVFLGILIGNLLSMVMGGSFIMPWGWTALGLGLCIGVGLLSGLYPAVKASKLDPVESLRYE
ncbi:ABC transporter permease [Daejeonella oryzae]|uniref:ABC transporter permease n=1 Tax=Daejeonella oryzae TaxID=1122943 RepID=UPI0003FE4D50|nr:ABC transporter permease [Daejeonella oryzae]